MYFFLLILPVYVRIRMERLPGEPVGKNIGDGIAVAVRQLCYLMVLADIDADQGCTDSVLKDSWLPGNVGKGIMSRPIR